MKNYKIENNRKINKKKLITTIALVLLLLLITTFGVMYSNNKNFMDFCDRYIFRKNIMEDNTKTIEISDAKSENLFAYKNYILILKDNKLIAYNKNGHEEYSIDIEISSPIYTTNGDYLCIAEKNGNKIYMISNQNILWENEVEGKISMINVNQNGYLSIFISEKSTVEVYNTKGNELFKRYLAKDIVISTSISNDNKYLAIAEVNYKGIVVQSKIEIISIEKAQTNADEALLYTYKAQADRLIIDIAYKSKNNLICMYDDHIDCIDEEYNEKEIIKFDDSIVNADINMLNSVVIIKNEKKGILTNISKVILIDIFTGTQKTYEIDDVTEKIEIRDNVLMANFGTDIIFINENGWLIKRFIGSKEVKGTIFSDKIAGIIYKDRIELVQL